MTSWTAWSLRCSSPSENRGKGSVSRATLLSELAPAGGVEDAAGDMTGFDLLQLYRRYREKSEHDLAAVHRDALQRRRHRRGHAPGSHRLAHGLSRAVVGEGEGGVEVRPPLYGGHGVQQVGLDAEPCDRVIYLPPADRRRHRAPGVEPAPFGGIGRVGNRALQALDLLVDVGIEVGV